MMWADHEEISAERDRVRVEVGHQFEIAVLVLVERGHRFSTMWDAWHTVLRVACEDRRRALQLLRRVEARHAIECRHIEIPIWHAGVARTVVWHHGELPVFADHVRAVARRPRMAWWRRVGGWLCGILPSRKEADEA